MHIWDHSECEAYGVRHNGQQLHQYVPSLREVPRAEVNDKQDVQASTREENTSPYL